MEINMENSYVLGVDIGGAQISALRRSPVRV